MQTSLKLIEVEQGSHEWLAARLGIITASNAGLLLTAFLSRLCGGEGDVPLAEKPYQFLSRLCGGEVKHGNDT